LGLHSRVQKRGLEFHRDAFASEARPRNHAVGFEAIECSPYGAGTHTGVCREFSLRDVNDDSLARPDALEESDSCGRENPNQSCRFGRRIPTDEHERNWRVAALEPSCPGHATALEVVVGPSERQRLKLESHSPVPQLAEPEEPVRFEAGELAPDHAVRESTAAADPIAQRWRRIGHQEWAPSRGENLEQRQARVDDLRENGDEDRERDWLEPERGMRERCVPGYARAILGSSRANAVGLRRCALVLRG